MSLEILPTPELPPFVVDLCDVFAVCGPDSLFLHDDRWWLLESIECHVYARPVFTAPALPPVRLMLRGLRRDERAFPVECDVVGVVPAETDSACMTPEMFEFVRWRAVRAWRFVTHKEAIEMEQSKENPFWVVMKRSFGGGTPLSPNGTSACPLYTSEALAIESAEHFAKADQAYEYVTFRAVARSRSVQPVSTTRIP